MTIKELRKKFFIAISAAFAVWVAVKISIIAMHANAA